MLVTSERYREMVYSRDFARHFVPEIIMQIIDTKARELSSYIASSEAYYSKLSQLKNEVFEGGFVYGTLEDYQFLLAGKHRIMPLGTLPNVECGWCAEDMSDENGNFSPPLELVCNYTSTVITVGRVYYFDQNYDSVPKDFDLEYYRKGLLIQTAEIRGNESYVCTSSVGVRNYDQLIMRVYSTTKPYRRVHIVEDIPGVYLTYGREQVVSLSLNQSIDVFAKELISGELDFQIENAEKTLDILNEEGFEQYLQRRQPVDVNLVMVFPDNTEERVPLGKMKLIDWTSQKGALTASFTARDSIDQLTLDEYVKGVFPKGTASMYELAEAVLKDAGVTDYEIDIELMNIYSTAPLPIGTHKELLRLISQASQSVVLSTISGGIHIKYISPLISCTNFLLNPAFDNDWTSWPTHTNCAFSQEYIYTGKQSVQLNTGAELIQSTAVYKGHKMYVRFYACPPDDTMSGSGTYMYLNGVAQTADLANANLQPFQWTMLSTIFEPESTSLELKLTNAASRILVDGFMCIDLTVTYGAGKEPDIDWCDRNIRFFTTQLLVPKYTGAPAVDSFDYSILIDSPEIKTAEAVKSVETNIYSYVVAAEESEVYKGARFVAGTEEFTIKFSSPAKDCKLEVKSLDSLGNPTSTNTATILHSELYAQAATIKVLANSEVQILVTGKAVTIETSQFKVDASLDRNLVADAKAETVDNRLITNKLLAEDITSYAIYWYTRKYEYDFDWRQNPAIEVYDTVQVYDDFGKNNNVLMTERNLEYQDGYLGGSSKGVC